ncbi:hypothetical protein SDC9_120036 [bioreactor metagenome]|uniref:Uncharacterized protein n=1 Tax=bioreactor metagenome TaxID=1076179 RepID=A0A645C5L6_9ZZZZ
MLCQPVCQGLKPARHPDNGDEPTDDQAEDHNGRVFPGGQLIYDNPAELPKDRNQQPAEITDPPLGGGKEKDA